MGVQVAVGVDVWVAVGVAVASGADFNFSSIKRVVNHLEILAHDHEQNSLGLTNTATLSIPVYNSITTSRVLPVQCLRCANCFTSTTFKAASPICEDHAILFNVNFSWEDE